VAATTSEVRHKAPVVSPRLAWYGRRIPNIQRLMFDVITQPDASGTWGSTFTPRTLRFGKTNGATRSFGPEILRFHLDRGCHLVCESRHEQACRCSAAGRHLRTLLAETNELARRVHPLAWICFRPAMER
jgi:hypothetical protein